MEGKAEENNDTHIYILLIFLKYHSKTHTATRRRSSPRRPHPRRRHFVPQPPSPQRGQPKPPPRCASGWFGLIDGPRAPLKDDLALKMITFTPTAPDANAHRRTDGGALQRGGSGTPAKWLFLWGFRPYELGDSVRDRRPDPPGSLCECAHLRLWVVARLGRELFRHDSTDIEYRSLALLQRQLLLDGELQRWVHVCLGSVGGVWGRPMHAHVDRGGRGCATSPSTRFLSYASVRHLAH